MSAKKTSRKRPKARGYRPRAREEVRTEMRHIREGQHPVTNRRQAIAIGLSQARKKGEKVPPPPDRRAA